MVISKWVGQIFLHKAHLRGHQIMLRMHYPNELERNSYLKLIWVRGYSDSPGNYAADALAKPGAHPGVKEINILVSVVLQILYLAKNVQNTDGLWVFMLHLQEDKAPIWFRKKHNVLMAVFTEHWTASVRATQRLPYNDFRRSYRNELEEKTVHIALSKLRTIKDYITSWFVMD